MATSVLMTTEGTYPYFKGGVSTWCDQLVTKMPDVRFHIFAVVPSPKQPLSYKLPENVASCRPFPLWGTELAGAQDAIVERLFHDFFVAGKDIGDRNVLLDAARDCGMDPQIVSDLLAGDADKESVREEIASAQNIGVTGVPFFILDGKFALPGAQPADVLKRAIGKALEKADEPRA